MLPHQGRSVYGQNAQNTDQAGGFNLLHFEDTRSTETSDMSFVFTPPKSRMLQLGVENKCHWRSKNAADSEERREREGGERVEETERKQTIEGGMEGGKERKKERRNWGEKIAEQRDSSIALLAWGVGGGGGLIQALSVSVLRRGDLIGRGRRERKGGSLRCRGRLQVSEDVTRQ